jgi:hypothetical protein
MFSVGDIVEWAAEPEIDGSYLGVVEEIRRNYNTNFYTVRWLDDGFVLDYMQHDLKLISKVS